MGGAGLIWSKSPVCWGAHVHQWGGACLTLRGWRVLGQSLVALLARVCMGDVNTSQVIRLVAWINESKNNLLFMSTSHCPCVNIGGGWLGGGWGLWLEVVEWWVGGDGVLVCGGGVGEGGCCVGVVGVCVGCVGVSGGFLLASRTKTKWLLAFSISFPCFVWRRI